VKVAPPIRRIDTARRPYWKDANDNRVPGVTSLLEGLPKKALINWSADATAAYAIDHWDELAALPVSERLKRLKGGRYESKDKAANRGKEVHTLAEKLAHGEEVEVPDAIAGHVESFVQFLDEYEPTVFLTEFEVYSYKHGYVGLVDAVFDIPTLGRVMVDTKTNNSGIFGETGLQLAGYRYADVWVDTDGKEQPMFPVDSCAGLHIRADGYSLVPITCGPQEHRDLLYVAETKRFDDNSRDLVGAPLTPPNRLKRRRLETIRDIEGVPA
jgi:hypothetical protein